MRPDLICICVPVVVSSHCIPFSICPLLDEDDRAELEKKIRYRQKFSDALNKEGIEVTEETHGDEVFMLLHVPFKRLCMEAERSKLEMGLKGVRLNNTCMNCFSTLQDFLQNNLSFYSVLTSTLSCLFDCPDTFIYFFAVYSFGLGILI